MGYYNVDKSVHNELRREPQWYPGEGFEESTDYRVAYGIKVMLYVQEQELRKTGKYLSSSACKAIVKNKGELSSLDKMWYTWDDERKCKVYEIEAEGSKIEVCVKGVKGGSSWVHSYCTLNERELARRELLKILDACRTVGKFTNFLEYVMRETSKRREGRRGEFLEDYTQAFNRTLLEKMEEARGDYGYDLSKQMLSMRVVSAEIEVDRELGVWSVEVVMETKAGKCNVYNTYIFRTY